MSYVIAQLSTMIKSDQTRSVRAMCSCKNRVIHRLEDKFDF